MLIKVTLVCIDMLVIMLAQVIIYEFIQPLQNSIATVLYFFFIMLAPIVYIQYLYQYA